MSLSSRIAVAAECARAQSEIAGEDCITLAAEMTLWAAMVEALEAKLVHLAPHTDTGAALDCVRLANMRRRNALGMIGFIASEARRHGDEHTATRLEHARERIDPAGIPRERRHVMQMLRGLTA